MKRGDSVELEGGGVGFIETQSPERGMQAFLGNAALGAALLAAASRTPIPTQQHRASNNKENLVDRNKAATGAAPTKAVEDDAGRAPGGGHQHIKVGLVPAEGLWRRRGHERQHGESNT